MRKGIKMKVGKLSNDMLKSLIIDNIKFKREEVVLRSTIGEDCAAIEFGDDVCLITTDPITGTANEVGRLAVHISCNDIASNGAEPIGILLTILAPESTTEDELRQIMIQANEEATKLNVEIIGGHTEITNAVNRIVVSSTAIAKQPKIKLFSNQDIKLGDIILMTKTAGIEGTGIIAYEKEEELKKILNEEELIDAKMFLRDISVVPEGIIAGKIGVTSMHDVTEGGILGAVWELCEGVNLGAMIDADLIRIHPITSRICNYFEINPLRLISSGTMIMTVNPNKVDILIEQLKQSNIEVSRIGEITLRDVYIEKRGRLSYVTPPDSDELYKVVF